MCVRALWVWIVSCLLVCECDACISSRHGVDDDAKTYTHARRYHAPHTHTVAPSYKPTCVCVCVCMCIYNKTIHSYAELLNATGAEHAESTEQRIVASTTLLRRLHTATRIAMVALCTQTPRTAHTAHTRTRKTNGGVVVVFFV